MYPRANQSPQLIFLTTKKHGALVSNPTLIIFCHLHTYCSNPNVNFINFSYFSAFLLNSHANVCNPPPSWTLTLITHHLETQQRKTPHPLSIPSRRWNRYFRKEKTRKCRGCDNGAPMTRGQGLNSKFSTVVRHGENLGPRPRRFAPSGFFLFSSSCSIDYT